MLVDLVQTTTRDGLRLDGMFQTAAGPAVPLDAVACVHGTGGNFYSSTLFDAVAQRLLALGVAVLRVNTRGHDLMSSAATAQGGVRLGAAYENFADCRHDLAAWVAWLRGQGRSRIGLVGHSSGALKCLYAQAHEPDTAVKCLLALSPPRLSYSWFAESDRAAEFLHAYQQAQALVAAGEPQTLLDVRLPLPFVVTAADYAEKYGPEERYNYLRFLDRVRCPTLVTFGSVEAANNMAFRGAAEAIANIAPKVCVQTITGADHFYTGARDALLASIERWLRGLGAEG
jgi:alpha-beta hydrolase superfamily lysophospholipase